MDILNTIYLNKKYKKNQITRKGKNYYKIIVLIILFVLNFYFHDFKFMKKRNIDAVLLMLPHHGNLGDQAISLAEIKFLKEIFPNIKLVYNLENYQNYIHRETIIFLQGGGNLGWTYNGEEKNRRQIIKSYPNTLEVILIIL